MSESDLFVFILLVVCFGALCQCSTCQHTARIENQLMMRENQ